MPMLQQVSRHLQFCFRLAQPVFRPLQSKSPQRFSKVPNGLLPQTPNKFGVQKIHHQPLAKTSGMKG
jgi:hypothetical protein